MQTIDESQVTDITVSTDINCSQSITESIISVNEMELIGMIITYHLKIKLKSIEKIIKI